MFCGNCGNELSAGTNFCPRCGAQVAAPVPPPQKAPAGKGKKPKLLLAPALLSIVPMLLCAVAEFIVVGFGFVLIFLEMLGASRSPDRALDFMTLFLLWTLMMLVPDAWFAASLFTTVHSLNRRRGDRPPMLGVSFLMLAGAYLLLTGADLLVYSHPDIVMLNDRGLKAFLQAYGLLLGSADGIAADLVCFVSMLLATVASFRKGRSRAFGIAAALALVADGVYLTVAWALAGGSGDRTIVTAAQLLSPALLGAALLIIHLCRRPKVEPASQT